MSRITPHIPARHLVMPIAGVLALLCASGPAAESCGEPQVARSAADRVEWLTLPSRFTHAGESGVRVAQHTPLPTPTAPVEPNFRSSGYTHVRSSLQYGQSADHYHRVQTWGDPVRPYGEWRFPHRPFSTPYSNWGPPYAGLQLGLGFGLPVQPGTGGGLLPGGPAGGGGAPNWPMHPYPIGPGSRHADPPYFDGHHPTYRD